MRDVVVLWVASSVVGFEGVAAHAAKRHVRLQACSMGDTRTAAAAGPAIAIVEDDRAATAAFGAGVDEVLRRAELTTEALDGALDRATDRGRRRMRRVARASKSEARECAPALVLLEWIAIELSAGLSSGALDGHLLQEGVRTLASLRAAALVGVEPRLEEILPASEAIAALDSITESFSKLEEVLQAIRVLSSSGGGSTSIGPLLRALSRVLRSRAIPLLDVEVEADPRCVTTLPSSRIVAALVALVDDALTRASLLRARGRRPRLGLRGSVEDGAAILEVQDDVAGAGDPRAAAPIARIDGGDVLVLPTPGSRTVRISLPLAAIAPLPDERTLGRGAHEG